jgi:hypothetical protein
MDFENNNVVPIEEPVESYQEHSCAHSCPRPFHQQDLIEAYHISKRRELDEKWATFCYETNKAFNIVKNVVFINVVNAISMASFNYTSPMYLPCKPSTLSQR